MMNQFEVHPYCAQLDLVEFCQSQARRRARAARGLGFTQNKKTARKPANVSRSHEKRATLTAHEVVSAGASST